MKKHIAFLSLILSALLFPALNAKDITVFANGKSNIFFDIDFSRMPDGTHRINSAAVTDFKNIFRKLTGQTLPVTASTGMIPLRARIVTDKNLSIQNCLVEVSEKEIMLNASDTLGIVNGLYTLLDHWGCRWIMPGPDGEVIPQAKTLTLPESGINFVNSMDSRVDSSWNQGDDHVEWRRRNRRGAKHRLTAQHYWLYAIPPSKYFKSNPEYFSLIGGKRLPVQLCTSNPDVRNLMVGKALEYLKTYPSNASFPMDPADGYDHCQCENCMKLDDPSVKNDGYICVSNRVTAFANFVAEAVVAKYPDKKVGFYAYANKKTPPSIKLHPAIFVPYTRDSSSLLHLMPDPAVPSSVEYWELLKKWQKVCPNMYAYEYDPISWTGSLPCPIYLERARALKKQHSMGIKGVITDLGRRADATIFVNRYMEARFKANPALDPEKELADMCDKFFGTAAKAMNNYFLTLAKVTDCKSDIRFGIDGYERLFTPEMIKRARNFLNQALAAENSPVVRKRIQMVNLGQLYLESYLHFIWNLKRGDYLQSKKDAEKIFVCIDNLCKADANYLNSASAKRRIETAVKKNMAKFFFDKQNFIRTWQIAGPFDNQRRDAVVTAGNMFLQNNQYCINGKAVQTMNYTSPEGFIDFSAAFAGKLNAGQVYYAYAATAVNSAASRPVQILTDSFYPFKVWLNNNLVYSRENMDADCPDKRQINVRLLPGINRIVVMVAQSLPLPFNRWGFWLRITDLQGNTVDLSQKGKDSGTNNGDINTALEQIQSRKIKNLVPRPSFEKLARLNYSGFNVWPPVIKANVSIDQSCAKTGTASVKFVNITDGSLNRFFKVKGGEKYLVGFDCLNKGKGNCYLMVSWRGKGKFLNKRLNCSFFPESGDGWQKVAGIVTVPQEADQLTFCIAVSGQSGNDQCFVDDLMLYKLQ